MSFLLDLSIIGGGLTGTAMLWQCIQQAQMAADENPQFFSRIRIRIFEKQEEFGPGFPHNQDNVLPFHITNMVASDMGIFPENPGDFKSWITRNQRRLIDRFDWFGRFMDQQGDSVCHHYPRAIMGEYLKTRFLEATQLARRLGISLEFYSSTQVEGIQPDEVGFRLSCHNLNSGKQFSMETSQVLIATGHWQKERLDASFFSCPWPAQMLQREIPKGAKVAVIGTSLSAIETLLTLTSEGSFVRSESGDLIYLKPEKTRTFCLYSIKGLLPKVRGRTGSYQNEFFCPKVLEQMWADNTRNSSLDDLFDILDTELQNAYGSPFDWNEIENPSGEPETLLSQSMVASGMILTEESRPIPNVKDPWGSADTGCYKTGSIWINPDTHQIMQKDPNGQIIQSEFLYAVGAMTRGQIINASMAQSIVRSVSTVAGHMFEKAIASSDMGEQQHLK